MNPHEYAIMYGVEDRHWWYRNLRALLGQFWAKYMGTERARVLDAGCGTGAVLDWLRERNGAEPVGVDLSPLALDFCKKRGRSRIARASIESIPFAAGSFDAAVSFDVLYHRNVSRKDVPLREIHRCLKPGGLLFLNLPAYQWLYSSHDVAVHTDKRFTRGEVVDLLRACGFEAVECTYWNTLLFPAIVLARLWRKQSQPGESDLTAGGGMADRVFSCALSIERQMIRAASLPFGLSIFAVGRRR